MDTESTLDARWVDELPNTLTQQVSLSRAEQVIQKFWPEWRIVGRLGSGATGSVFRVAKRVRDNVLESAVKVVEIPKGDVTAASLAELGLNEKTAPAYFERIANRIDEETKTMLSLKGASNIVLIEDVAAGRAAGRMGWDIAIRMELLESLSQRQGALGRPFSVRESVQVANDIANALVTCHKRGIIHRDVKPANIFWHEGLAQYKLGDFGVAGRIERLKTVVGTVPFMAPEIFNLTENYTPSVDIYALGMVLFYLLNGNRPPFVPPYPALLDDELRAQSDAARFKGETLPNPRDADCYLSDFIRSACDANPDFRFKSAQAFLSALSSWPGNNGAGGSRECITPWDMRQMTCPTCNERVPSGCGTRFCLDCGTDLALWDETIQMACPYCTQSVKAGTKYCPHCGKLVNFDDSIDDVGDVGDGGGGDWWKRIAFGVAAVALVGGTAFGIGQYVERLPSSSGASSSSSSQIAISPSSASSEGVTEDNQQAALEAVRQNILGTWYLVSGSSPGLTANNVADMWDYGIGPSLTLDDDGTGSFSLGGNNMEANWEGVDSKTASSASTSSSGDASDRKQSENALVDLSIDDIDCNVHLEGDGLVMEGFDGETLVFSRTSPAKHHNGSILADSDTHVYGAADLSDLTNYELCLARNEIFIRKGMAVESERIKKLLNAYGESGNQADVNSLNPLENTNVCTISRLEWERNTIYRNMLSNERRACYRAYYTQLAARLHVSEESLSSETLPDGLRLVQLVNYDGEGDTFEELLVVFDTQDAGESSVELWGYADGAVVEEHAGSIQAGDSGLTSLFLWQDDEGYAVDWSGDVNWEDLSGLGVDVLCYLIAPTDRESKPVPAGATSRLTTVDASSTTALTIETLATLKADYCDDSPVYGAWLAEVDNADDAWAQAVKLQALGFDSWKVQPHGWRGLESLSGGDNGGYCVTAGRFATEAEAYSAAEMLREKGYTNVAVVNSGSYAG